MSLSPASCWPGPALVSISRSVKWHHCTRALGVWEAHRAAPRKPQPEGRSRASPFSSRGPGPTPAQLTGSWSQSGRRRLVQRCRGHPPSPGSRSGNSSRRCAFVLPDGLWGEAGKSRVLQRCYRSKGVSVCYTGYLRIGMDTSVEGEYAYIVCCVKFEASEKIPKQRFTEKLVSGNSGNDPNVHH